MAYLIIMTCVEKLEIDMLSHDLGPFKPFPRFHKPVLSLVLD